MIKMENKVKVPLWFDSYARKIVERTPFNGSADEVLEEVTKELIVSLSVIIENAKVFSSSLSFKQYGLKQYGLREEDIDDLLSRPLFFIRAAMNGWELEEAYEITFSNNYLLTEVGNITVNTVGDISVLAVSDEEQSPLRFRDKEQAEALAVLVKGKAVRVGYREVEF